MFVSLLTPSFYAPFVFCLSLFDCTWQLRLPSYLHTSIRSLRSSMKHPLIHFCFAIHSLYSCGLGVGLLVCDFAIRSLYSCGPGVRLWFMILSFAIFNLAGQERTFFFGMNSLGSYLGAYSSTCLLREVML